MDSIVFIQQLTKEKPPPHFETRVENRKRYVVASSYVSAAGRKVCSHETFFITYMLRNTHQKATS